MELSSNEDDVDKSRTSVWNQRSRGVSVGFINALSSYIIRDDSASLDSSDDGFDESDETEHRHEDHSSPNFLGLTTNTEYITINSFDEKSAEGKQKVEKPSGLRARHIRAETVGHFLMTPTLRDELTPLIAHSQFAPKPLKSDGTTTKKKHRPRAASLPLNEDFLAPLKNHQSIRTMTEAEKEKLVRISAAFLMDYEASRPATLSHHIRTLTMRHLALRDFRVSGGWNFLLIVSATCLCGTPYIAHSVRHRLADFTLFTLLPVSIFFVDLNVVRYLRNSASSNKGRLRESRSNRHEVYLGLSLLLLVAESVVQLMLGKTSIIWSGMMMPITFFYLFREARDACGALRQVVPQIIGILAAQLSAEVIFATIAQILFGSQYTTLFGNLHLSFINLYELAITVVNPSLWLGIYKDHHLSAIFFVIFHVICNLYCHSLVLSIVFNSYAQALKKIRIQYMIDREDELRLAFQTLSGFDAFKGAGTMCFVPCDAIKKVLKILRPHYDEKKIEFLYKQYISNPGEHSLNYDAFRTRIPKALSISLRANRPSTTKRIVVKLAKVALALLNLMFVAMVTVPDKKNQILGETIFLFGTDHFRGETVVLFGIVITALTSVDIAASFFYGYQHWKTDLVFEICAAMSSLISICGIVLGFLPLYDIQLDGLPVTLLLMGRSIDLMRCFKLFYGHRDIARRTIQAWRCTTGPMVLLGASMHCMVYIGIALWGGLVTVGGTQDIAPLYDLNNFNACASGMLTIFNILIGNDWQAIVAVFLTVSSPTVVYPFFMAAREFLCILLNVLTAFLIEALVRPLNLIAIISQEEEKDLHKLMKTNMNLRSESITRNSYEIHRRDTNDAIINKLLMATDEEEDEIKRICNTLDLFETMTHREQVGFLVCSQSMVRFCNASFKKITSEYMGKEMVHVVVSEMQIDLFSLKDCNGTAVVRKFLLGGDEENVLEIRASILQVNPPMSLFVARHLKDLTTFNEARQEKHPFVSEVIKLKLHVYEL